MIAAAAIPGLQSRPPGWEARLAGAVDAARNIPYQLGEHDCFRFSCACVQAMTGVDLWPAWRGRYSTKLGALKLIAEYAGVDARNAGEAFTRAFSRLFQADPVPVAYARRGDIAEYRGAAGEGLEVEPHLVVINGRQAAGLGARGLYWIERDRCVHAWRIG